MLISHKKKHIKNKETANIEITDQDKREENGLSSQEKRMGRSHKDKLGQTISANALGSFVLKWFGLEIDLNKGKSR